MSFGMLKLRKVISGGQTGADQTALWCAMEMGLETGGMAPNGWKTEAGPAPWLGEWFGLVESHSGGYHHRTVQNVKMAEVTIWFGNPYSSGGRLTIESAIRYCRPYLINPISLVPVAEEFEIINVAGNRLSTNPGVVELVREAFGTLGWILAGRGIDE